MAFLHHSLRRLGDEEHVCDVQAVRHVAELPVGSIGFLPKEAGLARERAEDHAVGQSAVLRDQLGPVVLDVLLGPWTAETVGHGVSECTLE
eukprot:4499549-Alexandrium_andersonii.AAC.1